jgi:DNA-binding FrmR family transcriptional regulator
MLGGLTAAFDKLRREVLDKMTSVEGQVSALNDALSNIGQDLANIKSQLDAALADVQGQIDTAVAERLQAVSDSLTPVVERAQALAAETPDEPPAPAADQAGTPQDPNA